MKIAYLGLGSNLGGREAMLQDAVDRLHAADLRIARISSVYETAPLDFRAQPPFLNAVVEAESDLLPMQLLARIGKIERELGRKRLIAKGPRTIDIDILFFGQAIVRTAQLEIPHPRIPERRFVLEPMAELAPDFRHPLLRRSMRELLAATAGQEVRRTAAVLRAPWRSPAAR
jgi:2-amino-4-hydroxy-6-hydroxymethyldihydropteridine diphosphokinase